MRVTDLEKFSFEHIWRPFWPTYSGIPTGEPGGRIIKAPFGLDETVDELLDLGPSEWRDCVIDRLTRIGVTFPSWISHPLVDLLQDLIQKHEPALQAVTGLATLQFANGGLFDPEPVDGYAVHLIRSTRRGTPGPTLCGIDRFAKDAPGWSVNGGVSGPDIMHKPCPGCITTARTDFPGLLPATHAVGAGAAIAALTSPVAQKQATNA